MDEYAPAQSHPPPELAIVRHKRVRQRRGAAKSRIGLNITAMIDVVFLLLVYFMVATNFKLGEEIFRMDLPERGQAHQPDPFQLDEEPLRIAVVSMSEFTYHLQVQGAFVYNASSFDDLYDFLRERRIAPGRAGGLFAADHPLIVEPSQNARWEHAIGAFNAAVRAEYTNVSFRSAGS